MDKMGAWLDELIKHLEDNILSFWIHNTIDNIHGGFIGRITGNGEKQYEAKKGAVLNARIMWTFSAAYRILKKDIYLKMAVRAKQYFDEYFIDKTNGGVFWSVDYQGKPFDTNKHTYAIGFAIYAYSEFYRATNDISAKNTAINLFNDIETHCYDNVYGGYFEAFSETWESIEDMRLSEKDENAIKTMNTHLHILEPYTNLFKIWKSPLLKNRLSELVTIFLEKIIDSNSYHVNLYFNSLWETKGDLISYGHDIETTWLLSEAAITLKNPHLEKMVSMIIPQMIHAAEEGIISDGSMVYEHNLTTRLIDYDRHWWVQAEAIVGFYHHYINTGNNRFAERTIKLWEFIKSKMIDSDSGEWVWSVDRSGETTIVNDRMGFWKCPYHHARMCLEIVETLKYKRVIHSIRV
ncbi:cellobiose 2-epimerase [Paludibacter sp.]